MRLLVPKHRNMERGLSTPKIIYRGPKSNIKLPDLTITRHREVYVTPEQLAQLSARDVRSVSVTEAEAPVVGAAKPPATGVTQTQATSEFDQTRVTPSIPAHASGPVQA